jgi:hypothetical protein
MDWSRSTVTSSVRDLASVGEEPLLAHVVVERRQSGAFAASEFERQALDLDH